MDGDGALDIFTTQKPDDLLFWPAIYKNNGGGNFVLTNRLDTVKQGSSAGFADLDGDGDLDMIVTGATFGLPATAIFRNDGNFTFTAIPGPMDRFGFSKPVFADFDNNGTADVLMGSETEPPWGKALQLFFSNAQGQFSDPGELFGYAGEAAAGDLDKNGTLDVIDFFELGGSRTALYRNDTVMKNNAPTSPTNLQSEVTAAGVTFSWNASMDANQKGGLTYNLRVGTRPGAEDVMSSMSDPVTGGRRVVRIGNTGARRSWMLQIPSGRYYWSVQGVDYGYAGSPFAQEQEMDVPPGVPIVNIADIVRRILGDVEFRGVVHPNGAETMAYFEYGTNSFEHSTEPFSLPGSGGYTNLVANVTNLPLGFEWRVRLVASNAFGVKESAEKLFVTDNEAPTIALSVSQVSVAPNKQTGEIGFVIGDRETPADSLRLKVESSDWNLVPLENVLLSGTGTNRNLRVTASTNAGSAVITVLVTDSINAEGRANLTVKIENFTQLRGLPGFRAGDINRDGLLDMLNYYGNARFQTNMGMMRFRNNDFAQGSSTAGMFSDLDRDGILDLVVCSAFTTATTFSSGLYLGANNGLLASSPSIALPFRVRAAFESADFDGDGAPDLLGVGATNAQSFVRGGPVLLCASSTSIGFQPQRVGVRTFDYPALAAGDVDGDGRADFICTGMTNTSSPPVMFLYHNDGAGSFTESRMSLPGIAGGALALEDFDNDGHADLAISGSATISLTSGATAGIYRNNGDGSFMLHQTLTPAAHHASLQWGDVDGDSDYDLVLNGYRDGGTSSTFQIFVNEAGTFTRLSGLATLPPGSGASQTKGSAELADLDGDGDLDVLVAGPDGGVIYRNNLDPENLRPSAPKGLRVHQDGGRIVLEWDAPENSTAIPMTYNMRLGNRSGKDNFVPGMANPVSGKRLVSRRGNTENRKRMEISGLPAGRYFWSVQSIGPAYVGSEFAPESVFVIGQGSLDSLRMETIQFSESGSSMLQVYAPVEGELKIESSTDLKNWTAVRLLQVNNGVNEIAIDLAPGQKSLFVRTSLTINR